MTRPLIVIPTYWTNPGGPAKDRLINVYDHPTPIDREGTLSRALDSLRSLKGGFRIIVIGAATDSVLEEELDQRLHKIVRPFKDLDVRVFSYPELKKIHQRIEDTEFKDLIPLLALDGYSNIRNLGLVIAQILHDELVVFIDDDEVIADDEYINKAVASIGQEIDEEKVLGITGYYTRNREGEYLGSDEIPWWDRFWRKGWAMNQCLKEIGLGAGIKKTTLALGGAMVLHRELFEKVPFDPSIVRGEDIDYLINAMMYGHNFFLNCQLAVLHLPPEGSNHVSGLRQDIYRFVYETRKLEYSHSKIDLRKLTPDDLMPYPGLFLKHNIVWRSFLAALMTSLRDIQEQDFRAHLKNIRVALFEATAFARRHYRAYFEFQPRWVRLMRYFREDEILRTRLFKRR
jgi:glycosyltransferase involved in cell wall biosynthesis